MRRTLAVPALVLALASTLLGGIAQAEDRSVPARHAAQSAVPTRPTPGQALRTAREVLGQDPGRRTPIANRSATLALRDLFAARPRLTGDSRAQADRLLARPRAAKRKCSTHICVHWSTAGIDGSTNAWAQKTLDYMSHVWSREVGKLRYRAPLKDGRHGGNGKLDVYLKDLGGQGIYGYCAPEYSGPRPRTASGYCALDNDFSRAQFGIRPVNALHVTAAHEFFHASQFAYDYLEDAWIMEATATWMEEQVADGVNDNRQYLPYGQLGDPTSSLDWFNPNGVGQYGQWLYFQYLQQLYGRGIVRKIWGELPGRKHYSTQVLDAAIGDSFDAQYARFVAANLLPSSFYDEGRRYAEPYPTATPLDAAAETTDTATLDHLTSAGEHVVPGSGLEDTTWRLRVTMNGPTDVGLPVLVVVWQGTSGQVRRYVVDTDAAGVATRSIRFSSANTQAVYYAAVNAGIRYTCRQSTDYACAGVSKDDGRSFDLTATTYQS
jgi:hypothetical protein